jgi:hypothetical protein
MRGPELPLPSPVSGETIGSSVVEDLLILCLLRQLAGHDLVYVTPHPAFTWLNRARQRMVFMVRVLRSVAVLGRIATSHLAAVSTHPEMHPGIAQPHALFAYVLGGLGEFKMV